MTTSMILLSLFTLLSLVALARELHDGTFARSIEPPRSHAPDEFARTGSSWR
ncbi:hypothetical protein GCM10027020_17530 [Nocardioides salsibiostraticola]